MVSNPVCPYCSAGDVRRSHARGGERLARRLFLRKMYRCRGCNRRFGRISFDLSEDQPTLFLWAGIILAVILIVRIY